MSSSLELDGVTFGYDTAQTTLFENLSLRLGPGWHGLVGPNGAGKTSLLRLIDGTCAPQRGRILGVGHVVVCPQRTETAPDDFDDLLCRGDRVAHRLIGQLGLQHDWIDRWSMLSHGERKRVQVGCALASEPDVLALDEPTNHIDREAREVIGRLLASYRGIGLLVSHDRTLLDQLCVDCLMFSHGTVTTYPGSYSEAVALQQDDEAAAVRAHEQARKTRKRMQQTIADRRRTAAEADQRRSKRGLNPRDHDAKSRIDAARVSGKDGQAGRLQSQLDGRLRHAHAREQTLETVRRGTLGMTMRGMPARSDAVYRADAHSLPICPGRSIDLPDLVIRPTDRIGVVGPNGAGKSTLIRHLLEHIDMPDERIVVMPQEVDTTAAMAIRDDLMQLDSARRGEVLAAVDCLGSDPTRIIETESLSPGEVRKLILAMGLAREPHLLVMDEPTNHLDLPSIECLEHALAEVTCAVVLVSHDARFLDRLVTTCWTVSGEGTVACREADVQ